MNNLRQMLEDLQEATSAANEASLQADIKRGRVVVAKLEYAEALARANALWQRAIELGQAYEKAKSEART